MKTHEWQHAGRCGKTRRALLIVLVGVVSLLLLLVLLTPSIASIGPVRRAVFERVSRAAGLDVQARSWSVSWWRGVAVSDLTVRDPAGVELVSVPSLRVGLRWTSLLGRHIDLGDVLLERPRIRPNTREKMLGFLALGGGGREQPPDRQTPSVAMRLSVVGGSVEFIGKEARSAFEDWDLNLDLPPGDSPLTFESNLRIGDAPAEGRLRCKGSLTRSDSSLAFTGGECSLEGSKIDLQVLNPLLDPSGSVTTVAGVADLALKAGWEKDAPLEAKLHAQIKNFALSSETLSGDKLKLAQLELSGDVALSKTDLEIRQLEARCELFSATATGTLGGLRGDRPTKAGALQVRAEADLAALGNMLPRALHLAEGTRLTGGKATLTLNTSSAPEGWRATGDFDLSGLSGERQGKSYAMGAPVTGEFALRRDREDYVLERATFHSSFGDAQGATEGKTLTLTGEFDLAGLQAELGRFVDFKGVTLAGKARTASSVDMTDRAGWLIRSDTAFADLAVAGLTDAPIEENAAVVTFSGVYRADPGARAIEVKDLEVSGSSLRAKLSALWRELDGNWQVSALNGTAGGRLDLLSKLFSSRLGTLRASGGLESEFRFDGNDRGRGFDLRAKFSNLSLEGLLGAARPGALRSESAEFAAKGSWTTGDAGALSLDSFLVKTDFAECAGSARLGTGSPADLSVTLERILCDLARLDEKTDGLLPSGIRLAGALKGRGAVSTGPESPFALDLVAAVAEMSLKETTTGKVLFEDNVSLDLAGAWRSQAAESKLAFSRLRVSTDKYPKLAHLSGDANAVRSDGSFSLEGDLAFPLALAAPFLESRLAGSAPKGDFAWAGKLDFRRGKSLLADGKLACANLDVTLPRGEGKTVSVRESSLKADLGLNYDFPSATARFDRLVLDVPGLHLVSKLLFEELGKEPLPAQADLSCEMELAPVLERYRALLSLPEEPKLAGVAKIELSASTAAKVTQTSGKVRLERFSIGEGVGVKDFGDNPVEIVARLRADRVAQELALESLSVSSSFGNLRAQGALSHYATLQDLALTLDLSADLGALESLLKTILPAGLVLGGNAGAKLEAQGKIAGAAWRERLSGLNAHGMLSFDKLLYKGLAAGPMTVPVELKDGVVYIAESAGPLNEGKLRLAGSVDLMKDPPVYELKSPLLVIDGMKLKREIEFIHFLSPIFGNLAEVSGWADVEVRSAMVPLSKDTAPLVRAVGEVRYRDLIVRESLLLSRLASVIGGSGAGVQEIAPTRFEVRDGRVWLDETVLRYAGQQVAFSGSVGFDRSLDMLVRVLVTERLLGKDSGLMNLLVGEKVGVPITGTLDDPEVGADIFRKNMESVVKGAMKRTLDLGGAIRDILSPPPGKEKER